jgi:hypothetical protein
MTIYKNAKRFVDRGIGVFPIRYRAKTPAVAEWKIYQRQLPTAGDLSQWFPCETRNFAVCLGWQRLAVLDFDSPESWQSWNLWTLDNCHLLDNAYTVKTRRGAHVYFSLLEDLSNMKMLETDFKSHGYVLGEGSTHPSGHVYTAIKPDMIFPVIEKLSDVIPAEMIKHAIYEEENLKPVAEFAHPSTPAGDIFSEIENAAQSSAGALTPLEIALQRYPIESFFPGVKIKPNGIGEVNCLFHSPDNVSAWFSIKTQVFGCHRCNFKPMSSVGLYAALYCSNDIKMAVREMSK